MKAWPDPAYRDVELNKIISAVKRHGAGKRYDCIIGLSGGVDSSYLAVKVAEWGLRPLVVHVDAGWNSELAVMNIHQICSKLNFDLVTHVIDCEDMREMQLAFLKSGLANQDVHKITPFLRLYINMQRKPASSTSLAEATSPLRVSCHRRGDMMLWTVRTSKQYIPHLDRSH